MEEIKDICDLKKKLIDLTKSKFNMGLEQVDTKEAGDVIDMIKDLAEAEEKCVKACYYKTIIEAMEDDSRYGYNRHRDSQGRFTSGYHEGAADALGYHNGGMRNYDYRSEPMMKTMQERFGYTPVQEAENNLNRWRNARRHYQETRSKSDKEEMDMHAKAHLAEAMATLKEVMSNSDPDLQRKMKNDLTNLINDIS